jgi:ribonuclease P protein component
MLSFRNRFHGHGSLRYVYKNGQAVRSHLVTLKYTANPRRSRPRVAVVVSKKVHKGAVGRNRIRRRIYEIVRRELPQISPKHDIVFLVFSSEVLTMPHEDLERAIRQLIDTAGIYKKPD